MAEERDRRRLEAPAKLNLGLRVVGRRPDGYHELESTLVLLELADVLSVDPARPDLTVDGPAATGVPRDHDNLAWRGWQTGWGTDPPPIGLHLEKHVPAASGLGGGSSDAAAAWRLARAQASRAGTADPPETADVAALASIGADVPFFAAQVAVAHVGGIGERVEPLPGQEIPAEVVLVLPPFTLSTAAVFAELRASDWTTGDQEPVDRLSGQWSNDLLAPARRLRPELDHVFRTVSASGGEPHLTGSGPTVFVLTDDPERAEAIAERVERAGLAATRTRLRTEPASIER